MRHWLKSTGLSLLLALPMAACSDGISVPGDGSPQGGTETGNPPFLDENLIKLVVSNDAVHIVGEPGAVRPGGSEVQALSALTGRTITAKSRADGSFDMLVDTVTDDSFLVTVVRGEQSSSPVYVVRGGAAVGVDNAQQLSCQEREQLAGAQMSAAGVAADRSCTRHEDCMLAPSNSLCSDACFAPVVSALGAQQIKNARATIEGGLCKTYQADGCKLIIEPCFPGRPGTRLACEQNECVLAESGGIPIEADCSSPFDPGPTFAAVSVYWYYPEGQVCLPRTYGGTEGNANRYPSKELCESNCLPLTGCPDDRTRGWACVQTGPTGACAENSTACLRACTAASDCAGDEIGTACVGGWCQQATL